MYPRQKMYPKKMLCTRFCFAMYPIFVFTRFLFSMFSSCRTRQSIMSPRCLIDDSTLLKGRAPRGSPSLTIAPRVRKNNTYQIRYRGRNRPAAADAQSGSVQMYVHNSTSQDPLPRMQRENQDMYNATAAKSSERNSIPRGRENE